MAFACDAAVAAVVLMHDYALLTTAGLESVALDALASECGLRASALPAPTARKGESFGSAGGLGILVASRQEPLAACALSAPVLQAALAVVVRCEVEDGDVLAAAVGSVSEERWRSAMRTHAAHAAPLPPSAPSFRIASLRAGQHDFDSRALSSALGAAVSALQPSWRVDLEAPDVCVLALLVNRSLLIGALLPPFSPRKSDPLPMEPRQWLVRGERAHMRPHRAALLARLLAPASGEVLPCSPRLAPSDASPEPSPGRRTARFSSTRRAASARAPAHSLSPHSSLHSLSTALAPRAGILAIEAALVNY